MGLYRLESRWWMTLATEPFVCSTRLILSLGIAFRTASSRAIALDVMDLVTGIACWSQVDRTKRYDVRDQSLNFYLLASFPASRYCILLLSPLSMRISSIKRGNVDKARGRTASVLIEVKKPLAWYHDYSKESSIAVTSLHAFRSSGVCMVCIYSNLRMLDGLWCGRWVICAFVTSYYYFFGKIRAWNGNNSSKPKYWIEWPIHIRVQHFLKWTDSYCCGTVFLDVGIPASTALYVPKSGEFS